MLSSLFSIDICAYAVMSNHYHIVVKVNPAEPSGWSDDQVLERWTSMFRGPILVQRRSLGEELSTGETDALASIAAVYRSRLADLSWFMKCLNQPIARMANKEDGCTGHFWEARFHSQPLRSERALFAAMAYVDLNPIRAGLARTPETSEFTSLKTRVDKDRPGRIRTAIRAAIERGELRRFRHPIRPLMAFSDAEKGPGSAGALPMREPDYLKLVDIAGRVAVSGKRGRIDPSLESILDRLQLSADQWINAGVAFRKNYRAGYLTNVA